AESPIETLVRAAKAVTLVGVEKNIVWNTRTGGSKASLWPSRANVRTSTIMGTRVRQEPTPVNAGRRLAVHVRHVRQAGGPLSLQHGQRLDAGPRHGRLPARQRQPAGVADSVRENRRRRARASGAGTDDRGAL